MFTELEIGPHFITLYTSKYREMLEIASKYQPIFCKKYPELSRYQQKEFKHEPNDPRVYHRFGEPNIIRPGSFRHFHIRTVEEPDQELINTVIKDLKLGSIKITRFMDNYPDDEYPERRVKEDYLDYIQRLKDGK